MARDRFAISTTLLFASVRQWLRVNECAPDWFSGLPREGKPSDGVTQEMGPLSH
jgi:hypothetical protein